MYAIIEAGGKQLRVEPGSSIRVEKLGLAVGDEVSFDKVLLVQNDGSLSLGKPYLDGARVVGRVVDQGRDAKILVFRKKRRKQYRRTRGHRQPFTAVSIEKIKVK